MGIGTFIKLGKTAMEGKQAMDSFNTGTAISMGKKTATAPLKAWENVPRWVCRGLQLLFGLIVAGFYGHRIDADRRAGSSPSVEWGYGVVVASLACITAVAFALAAPFGAVSSRFKTHRLWACDVVLFILWIVAFAVFAGIFLKRDNDLDYKGASTRTMKGVVWLDFVNAILWLVSGLYGLFKTFLSKKVDEHGERMAGKVVDKVADKVADRMAGRKAEV
ncbi:hypothetical protein QBC46DRAFT_389520 [Diplogelasinospora grovesii]|uniref:MARVEL domain-containing protein n=1 Tax=Diplogelasinospora grovesii TaxID=303347 RepID=A0AAN6S3L1_9PEZI|nr:hypothetical protein QBC46DRAFT_389520 [Diplogelasinospora grovesii]